MLRHIVLVIALAAGVSSADPVKCKKVFVGKGLERHAVCQIDQPVKVSTSAKPNVVVVHKDDGRTATGRPKSGDRLDGLSHQLRP